MAYTIECPVCGRRDLYEFDFGNVERGPLPPQRGLTPRAYHEAVREHVTVEGPQQEWWCHRAGCGTWFTAWRDTTTIRQVPGPGGAE